MDLLTVNEAADLLRISPHTLRCWVMERKIVFVRVGGRVLFRREDLERLIEHGVQPAHTQRDHG